MGLLAIGLGALTFGLLAVSMPDFLTVYVSIIITVVGVLFIVGFFLYDQKVSKHKIFLKEMLNRNVVLIMVMLTIGALVSYGERSLIPYNYAYNL